MTSREETAAALQPTIAALLHAAETDAAVILAAIDADSNRRLVRAKGEADRRLAQARSEGEREARAVLDAELRQAQGEARRLLLRAKREEYEELDRRVRAVAQDMRTDPSYGRLLDGLMAAARERLGPEATVIEAPSGGVIGELGARRIDLSLEALATRALAACPEVAGTLWQT